MSDLARIYPFPTVDVARGDRSATFGEYLRSLDLQPSTVINHEALLAIAEDRARRNGVDLETVDGDTLASLIAEGDTDWTTNQLRTALDHFYRYKGLVMPRPGVAKLPLLPGIGDGPGGRPDTFEEYLVSIGLSANTVRNYKYRLALVKKLLADMGATLLTADAFQLAAMTDQTSNTHSLRGQIRCSLKHYYEWQDRMNAPLRAVRVPPAPRMVCQALEPDDARKLVETATGWWPKGGMVLLGLYLALRREEIAKAEWVRFDDDMEWYRVTGKGDKTATIPVHPVIREEFEPRRGEGFIFPGRLGVRDHVHPATVGTWIGEVAEAAGLGHVRPHELRHTSLTTALDNTENLRAVMEFARHERPQTTAGYTRTTKEQLRRVSDALDFG